MMAEGRTIRHPQDLRVQLHYHGRHFYAALGRRLSRAGIDLDVRNLTLPVGTEVVLELDYCGRPWRLEAVVIHRSPAGVRVRFAEEHPDLDSPEAEDRDGAAADSLIPPQCLGGRAAAAGPVLTRAHD